MTPNYSDANNCVTKLTIAFDGSLNFKDSL